MQTPTEKFRRCKTEGEATGLYAQLLLSGAAVDEQSYDALTELFRRTLIRLGSTPPTKKQSTSVNGPDVRRWAREQGIPITIKGRLPLRVENAYRAAHGLPVRGRVERTYYVPQLHATPAQVREWARQHGVPVGKRGRLHPDVIAAYAEANSTPAQIRDWAMRNGVPVGKRGRIHPDVIGAYAAASVQTVVRQHDATPSK